MFTVNSLSTRLAPTERSSLKFNDMLSHYAIITSIATTLTTHQLFKLSCTSKANHSHIAANPATFRGLAQYTICDGKGITARKSEPSADFGIKDSQNLHCLGHEGELCERCGCKVCDVS